MWFIDTFLLLINFNVFLIVLLFLLLFCTFFIIWFQGCHGGLLHQIQLCLAILLPCCLMHAYTISFSIVWMASGEISRISITFRFLPWLHTLNTLGLFHLRWSQPSFNEMICVDLVRQRPIHCLTSNFEIVFNYVFPILACFCGHLILWVKYLAWQVQLLRKSIRIGATGLLYLL